MGRSGSTLLVPTLVASLLAFSTTTTSGPPKPSCTNNWRLPTPLFTTTTSLQENRLRLLSLANEEAVSVPVLILIITIYQKFEKKGVEKVKRYVLAATSGK